VAAEDLCRQILSHRNPIQVGQAYIEYDEIGRARLDELQGFHPICSFDDSEPFEPQRSAPHPPQRCVVFDDQDDLLTMHG